MYSILGLTGQANLPNDNIPENVQMVLSELLQCRKRFSEILDKMEDELETRLDDLLKLKRQERELRILFDELT